jgi:hypothetical protein
LLSCTGLLGFQKRAARLYLKQFVRAVISLTTDIRKCPSQENNIQTTHCYLVCEQNPRTHTLHNRARERRLGCWLPIVSSRSHLSQYLWAFAEDIQTSDRLNCVDRAIRGSQQLSSVAYFVCPTFQLVFGCHMLMTRKKSGVGNDDVKNDNHVKNDYVKNTNTLTSPSHTTPYRKR